MTDSPGRFHRGSSGFTVSSSPESDVTSTRDHPVWNVYDEYRRARLNVRYYCARLAKLERRNLVLEWIVAAAAGGSAVAGLTVWDTNIGRIAWQSLAIAAALAAVSKPLLKYTERIKKLEHVITEFRRVEHDLKKLKIEIETRKAYDATLQERFRLMLDSMNELVALSVESEEDSRLRDRCEDAIRRELPANHFYVPPRSPVSTTALPGNQPSPLSLPPG